MIILWTVAAIVVTCFGLVVFRGAPYVPTHRRELRRAFAELYPITPEDVVVDVGSGDGIVLREVARHGARAVGFEINPILVYVSRWLSRHHNGVEVRLADFWLVDLPEETTMVYVFGVSRDMPKLIRRLQIHVNSTGRPVMCMGYGSGLPGYEPLAQLGAHRLYRITPLQ